MVVTVFISLSGLLPKFSSCRPLLSLFKLVVVAIKGTWIKVSHVRDNNKKVEKNRNKKILFLFFKKTNLKLDETGKSKKKSK